MVKSERNYLEVVAHLIFDELFPDTHMEKEERLLFLGYATLALSHGPFTTNEHVHDMRSMWATINDHYIHDSLKPYDDLPTSAQALNTKCTGAIRTVAFQLKSGLDSIPLERDEAEMLQARDGDKIVVFRDKLYTSS